MTDRLETPTLIVDPAPQSPARRRARDHDRRLPRSGQPRRADQHPGPAPRPDRRGRPVHRADRPVRDRARAGADHRPDPGRAARRRRARLQAGRLGRPALRGPRLLPAGLRRAHPGDWPAIIGIERGPASSSARPVATSSASSSRRPSSAAWPSSAGIATVLGAIAAFAVGNLVDLRLRRALADARHRARPGRRDRRGADARSWSSTRSRS